jgi:hypothetical protein
MGARIDTGKLGAVAVLAFAGLGAIAVLRSGDRARGADVPPSAKDPRQVLGRPWFDHYPKTRRDDVDLWLFSSAGIGLHERGSVWRSGIDFFDFERQGSRLELTFLHDGKKGSVAFEVVACDDQPPFDLCLDVREPLRGKKRFYSFAYDDEMDAHVPWARAWRASAETRIGAPR